MENSKRGSIPMQKKLRLNKSQGASTPAKLKHMQNIPYASAVGSIMYAVRCDLHWTTVKNILKYLRNTKDMFLSQTGYVFVLNGGVVDWKSAKHSIFATSSAEAEYIAAFDASKEALMNLESLKVLYISVPKFTTFVKLLIFGDSKLCKSSHRDNLADLFTKALAFPNHSELTRNIGMLPASSLMNVISIKNKLNYLEQPLPPAPVAPAGQQVAPEILTAHTTWVKGSKDIAGLMLMTMDSEIQQNLEKLHAYDMLQELKTLFAQQAEQELLQTTRDFHSCKQEEGHLRKEFNRFVQNYNMHSLGKTVNELHGILKLHEQTLALPKNNAPALPAIRAGNGKNNHAYAHKPKIPPLPKREDPANDSICHECGEIGHWKRNFPKYLAELLKKKKNAASGAGGLGIFAIELSTFLNRSWIYATGCGTHICNTTQGLRASRKLNPGALSLYVGNGQREAVKAIGNFDLSLPSGLVIVLNNYHYAPSITTY
ncbi:zinc finger, CCHC-type containing protein [Tanacetum coccineum]